MLPFTDRTSPYPNRAETEPEFKEAESACLFLAAKCLVHFEAAVFGRLGAMRRTGESYSDAILRVARETTPTKQAT